MLSNRRWLAVLGLLLSFTLVAAACGDDDDSDSGSGDDATGEATGGESAAGLPTCLDFADLYALTGPESDGFANWSDASELAAELGSTTELPDAPLTVAGPGEESGTFDSYVELVIETFNEDRGADAAPRADYQSSPNDNVIVENLAAAEGSLGWVGFAFYIENTDTLQAFELSNAADGVDCTAPTPETIASGDYPLSRGLYIYVNNAKAEESGSLSAFVDLYLGDLYDCATQAGYVALADDALAETVATWEDSGLAGGEDDGTALDVSGSSTVEPISQCVLAESGFSGSVEGPGTGDGFPRFCAGETDISDASRPIKDEEATICEDNGVEYTELLVAIDGMAVMTAAG